MGANPKPAVLEELLYKRRTLKEHLSRAGLEAQHFAPEFIAGFFFDFADWRTNRPKEPLLQAT